MVNRYEPDGWTLDGAKITSPDNLARIREATDEGGGIIVRHWHYRGSSRPDIRGFSDFDEFDEYLREHARPGDAFDVWSFSAVCHFDQVIAEGKFPDSDGCVPAGGAY